MIIKGEEVKRLLGKKEIKVNLDRDYISLSVEYYSCPVHGNKYTILSKCLECSKRKGTRMKRYFYNGVGYTE